mmetsp:Transcript_23406/g.55464  ORF Transcript_23406/g.55464 Transcript_23406/m.55464 type:complete len:475 (-) Transcript_23406:31-1455(-)
MDSDSTSSAPSSVVLFVTINALVAMGLKRHRQRANLDGGGGGDSSDDQQFVVSNKTRNSRVMMVGVIDDLPTHLQRELYKDQRRKQSIPRLARKSPLYDNYRMYGPDGTTLLCTTSAKKARWYVRKNLAEWWQLPTIIGNKNDSNGDKTIQTTFSDSDVSPTDSTKSIRLLFVPKNQKCLDDDIGTAVMDEQNMDNGNDQDKEKYDDVLRRSHKDNICVVCGTTEGLVKHYVMPHCYRRKMPTKFKSHHSHDIVLLCVPCHTNADRDGRVPFEKELDRLYRKGKYHTRNQTNRAMIPDQDLKRVQSCARALLWHSDKIPIVKRKQCEETLQGYIMTQKEQRKATEGIAEEEGNGRGGFVETAGTGTLSSSTNEQLLNELANMETDRPNPYHISTPDLIVQERLTTVKLSNTATTINGTNNEMSVPLGLQQQQGNLDDTAIEEFVREWRRLFIDTLQPQYLPKGWSINSSVSNDD